MLQRFLFTFITTCMCLVTTCAQLVQVKNKTINPFQYVAQKSALFTQSGVASAHPLASEIGALVMQQGGNTFDAAIAVNFALAVVYPEAGNIGGGGFMLARKKDGKLIALDYRETAPLKAYEKMYLDSAGNPVEGLSVNGHLSAGVPGSVAGLFAMHAYAKWPMRQLIQPAIDLAEHGFAITASEARALNYYRQNFIVYNTQPNAFIKSTAWKEGDTLVQADLANTLKRIRDKGLKGFYEGETAKLIVAEMQRGKGFINYDDLKQYQVKKRKPIQFNYRSYEIISFPPPSSGGVLLAQMLKMIEPYPISSYGFQSVPQVQLMIEVERRAYADRAAHLGDPDFWNVPLQTLLSSSYLKQRMKDYDSTKASKSIEIQPGYIAESEQTTHISIFDKEGNMVAITTTLNNSYGSKTVVGGAGFLLNDEMDDFSIKPGVPNMYGAIGGKANAIQPKKRMLSSMTPTLVLKNKKPFLITGTPGGTTIPTSVLQTLVNVIDFNMTAAQAINQPKFHHQWLPDTVYIEPAFSSPTKLALEKMGYHFQQRSAIGRVETIKILPDGKLEVAADIRGNDSVSGW